MSKNKIRIKFYMHCSKCLDEVKNIEGESPRSYTNYEFGYTDTGIQFVCKRHDIPVLTKDLPPHFLPELKTMKCCDCEICKQKIEERVSA